MPLEPSKTELFKAIVDSHQKVSNSGRQKNRNFSIDSVELDIDIEKEHRVIKKEIEKFRRKYQQYTSGERDV